MSLFSTIKHLFINPPPPEPSPQPQFSEERYQSSIEAERALKNNQLRMDPYSPIENRTEFDGLTYFDPDPAFRYHLRLQPTDPETLLMQTSTDDEAEFIKVGWVDFEVEGQSAKLAVYQREGDDGYFLPFRDATSGHETYGAGRYLEPADIGDGKLLVDFNLAYNPYCAYSPSFSCPVPPRENWLNLPIRAGEKRYGDDVG